jgi:hypothetical protein
MTPGELSVAPCGAPWPVAAAPPVKHTPDRRGGYQRRSLLHSVCVIWTSRLCQGDEPGGAPSLSALLAASVRWVCGPLFPSSPVSFGRTAGDGRESSSRNARPIRDGSAPPGLRAGPFSRALRLGISAGYTHPILLTTGVVNGAFSYLNGCLPLAERAAACSGSGGGLALACPPPRGWATRCPKLRETCALSVWMRSVDDWPLAKILPRFLGVSYGR